MVVVILAAMWILVLVPPLLRSRSEGRPSASVHTFRRQLSTLGRATPPSMVRLPVSYGSYGGPAHRAPVRSAGPRTAPRPTGPQSYARTGAPHGRYGHGAPSHRLSQRSAAKRRRQQVLLTLVGLAFFTGVLAFGLSMQPLVWVFAAVLAALAGYVYLLVRLRQAEEARAWRAATWYEAA